MAECSKKDHVTYISQLIERSVEQSLDHTIFLPQFSVDLPWVPSGNIEQIMNDRIAFWTWRTWCCSQSPLLPKVETGIVQGQDRKAKHEKVCDGRHGRKAISHSSDRSTPLKALNFDFGGHLFPDKSERDPDMEEEAHRLSRVQGTKPGSFTIPS